MPLRQNTEPKVFLSPPGVQDHLNRISAQDRGSTADADTWCASSVKDCAAKRMLFSWAAAGAPTPYIQPPILPLPGLGLSRPAVPWAVPLPQALKSDAQIAAEAPYTINPRTGERYRHPRRWASRVLGLPVQRGVLYIRKALEALGASSRSPAMRELGRYASRSHGNRPAAYSGSRIFILGWEEMPPAVPGCSLRPVLKLGLRH